MPVKLRFVDSDLFRESGAIRKFGRTELPALPTVPEFYESGGPPRGWYVMSRKEEAQRFLEYNFAKRTYNNAKGRSGSEDHWLSRSRHLEEYLVRMNLPLMFKIVTVAPVKARETLGTDGCLSEGQLGLLQAIQLFDVSNGNKFSTYAYPSILHRITGTAARTQRRQLPMTDELSIHIAAPEEEESDYAEEVDQLKEVLHTNAAELTAQELCILRQRFSLDDCDQLTLDEIGQEFNLSKERVRQIQNIALKKLKVYLLTHKLG